MKIHKGKKSVNLDSLCSITSYAYKVGMTRQHVWRLVKSGKLNSIEIDGQIFVIDDSEKRD